MIARTYYFIRGLMMKWRARQQRAEFLREWALRNPDNDVYPVTSFPLYVASAGKYSYGELNLVVYNDDCASRLVIGDFVSISTDVKFILDGNHQVSSFSTFPIRSRVLGVRSSCDALSRGDIVVENDVWIGNRVTILSGVRIGKGAIIAAGALVNRDVPAFSIAGGVPARMIRMRFPPEIIERLERLDLSELPKEVIAENIDLFYQDLSSPILEEIETLFEGRTHD